MQTRQPQDQTPQMPQRGICAHRGDCHSAPENTLPAFLIAAVKGCHMIELDVWMTRDAQLVVMHDETVDRTTDGTGRITQMTLAEIKSLDAGAKFGSRWAGVKVPTLTEVLASDLPGYIWLNVHTRDHGPRDEEYISLLVETVRDTGRAHQVVLACFDSQARVARSLLPELRICNMTGQSHAGSDYPRLAIDLGADFLQFFGWHDNTPAAVELLHSHGVKVNYFKADKPEMIRKLLEIGVDFVLTDRLELALAVWHQTAGQPPG